MVSHIGNEYISEAMKMAQRIMRMANCGELLTNNDECGVLFGVLRDCAYKIRKQAMRDTQIQKQKTIADEIEYLLSEQSQIQKPKCEQS